MERDPELQDLIRQWAPPTPAAGGFDERMMSRYALRRASFWHRRLVVRIVVPAPVLAAMVLLAIASIAWTISRTKDPPFEPVKAPTLVVTRAEVTR
jgi:hypothetical protein